MKSIIFSFDDGLQDFYDNVFPILKKYGIKATLNVITGFSDHSIKTDYRCCSIDQIDELLQYGIEIANHSDDHVFPEPLEGYDVANKKLLQWFPNYKVKGVSTPFTQTPPKDFYKWCRANNIKYVRYGSRGLNKTIRKVLSKIKCFPLAKYYYFKNTHYSKKRSVKIVYSFSIKSNKPASYYERIISDCCFNPKITLMFHSLFETESMFDYCPYPEGAWTVSKFEELIKWCIQKKYRICRQSDTV